MEIETEGGQGLRAGIETEGGWGLRLREGGV